MRSERVEQSLDSCSFALLFRHGEFTHTHIPLVGVRFLASVSCCFVVSICCVFCVRVCFLCEFSLFACVSLYVGELCAWCCAVWLNILPALVESEARGARGSPLFAHSPYQSAPAHSAHCPNPCRSTRPATPCCALRACCSHWAPHRPPRTKEATDGPTIAIDRGTTDLCVGNCSSGRVARFPTRTENRLCLTPQKGPS